MKPLNQQLLALLTLLAFGLTACGGGGGNDPAPAPVPTPTPNTIQVSLPLLSDMTGYVTARNADRGFNQSPIRMGDLHTQETLRGIVSFDISSLPAGAQILSAQFEVIQANVVHNGVTGGDPFQDLGTISAERIDGTPPLDTSEWSAPVLSTALKLVTSTRDLGLRAVDVTDWVAAGLAEGRDRLDMRMYFELASDFDNRGDWATFDDGPFRGRAPTLVVQYR